LRALLWLLLLCGCPGAHTGYPDKSCKTTSDCYAGETCVITNEGGTCQPGSGDGGTP
jgi:hypothetical protein